MFHRIVCLALLIPLVWSIKEGEAQILRRIRERRAALSAPPVDPGADPAASPPAEANSPTPPPEVNLPWRGGFLARRLQRRRDLVAQQAAEAEPTPAPPLPPQPRRSTPMPAYAARQPLPQPRAGASRQPLQALRQASATAAPQARSISPQQMASMALPQLQAALSETSAGLANELRQFSSAASWQGFLSLPEGIVDEPTIDIEALENTVSRFEKVASNSQFSQIANLNSFQQARAVLTELLNRVDVPAGLPSADEVVAGDGPRLISPKSEDLAQSGTDTLPAPAPRLPRNEGEHSILIKSGN